MSDSRAQFGHGDPIKVFPDLKLCIALAHISRHEFPVKLLAILQ